MDRSKLKTVIILILTAVNLFLLGTIGWRLAEERSARERTAAELVQRFAAMDVTLSAALPEGTTPAGQTLARSVDNDAAMAKALLGEDARSEDLGGGIWRYTSAAGQGVFRAGGSFEVSGRLGSDPEALCKELCRQFGYKELQLNMDAGEGSARQYFGSLPVLGGEITFQAEGGVLTAVRGTLLPQLSAETEDVSSITAVTALTLFLEDCRAVGTVVSEVTEVVPCYELQSTAASPMTLSPAWRITADTGEFTVSCATGKVTHY